MYLCRFLEGPKHVFKSCKQLKMFFNLYSKNHARDVVSLASLCLRVASRIAASPCPQVQPSLPFTVHLTTRLSRASARPRYQRAIVGAILHLAFQNCTRSLTIPASPSIATSVVTKPPPAPAEPTTIPRRSLSKLALRSVCFLSPLSSSPLRQL